MAAFSFKGQRGFVVAILATLITVCLVFSLRTTSYDPVELWKSSSAPSRTETSSANGISNGISNGIDMGTNGDSDKPAGKEKIAYALLMVGSLSCER